MLLGSDLSWLVVQFFLILVVSFSQTTSLCPRKEGGDRVGEAYGPQRDSPSHSLSNRQICKDTFPVVLPAVPLVALPVRWDRSTHVRTSGIPAGIPGSTDTLLQTADRQHCVTKIAISVSEIIFVS